MNPRLEQREPAGVVFGAVWQGFGSEAAFGMGAAIALAAALLLPLALPRERNHPP
ncbi:MAG TPA: hypothetical protein VHG93_24740 [Longimicrobium sp.]|nr:hypothetical protein [Longimicrobium sp.]